MIQLSSLSSLACLTTLQSHWALLPTIFALFYEFINQMSVYFKSHHFPGVPGLWCNLSLQQSSWIMFIHIVSILNNSNDACVFLSLLPFCSYILIWSPWQEGCINVPPPMMKYLTFTLLVCIAVIMWLIMANFKRRIQHISIDSQSLVSYYKLM